MVYKAETFQWYGTGWPETWLCDKERGKREYDMRASHKSTDGWLFIKVKKYDVGRVSVSPKMQCGCVLELVLW